jgi:DMSO/TMAO reductase YedYZ molybdopterin-dependent catalytic subunit
MKKLLIIFLVIVMVLFVMVLLTGCLNYSPIKELKGVEIREYKGEKLDSVNNFRENSIKGPQYININNYKLEINGLVDNPKEYTYDEVLSHQAYSKVLTLYCVEGWSAKILWEGVLLRDLLNEAGVKQGALTVIFHAYDGYTSSLALDYVMNNNILLAYKMNNVTLPPERGFPFQVVAEDKWGYKWVKWVTKIEISGDPDYKGYWESNGYDNNGDITG